MSSAQNDYEARAEADEDFEGRLADRIFKKMKGYISAEVRDTLEDNQDTIADFSKQACSSSMREISTEVVKDQRRLTLKRKGNQIQLDHALEVKADIQSAKDAIAEKNMEKALQRLDRGLLTVDKRIKNIKLADREPLGWAVVRHYEADALADNSDDEKKIEKSRKAAAAEAKALEDKRKKDRDTRAYRPFSRRNTFAAGGTAKPPSVANSRDSQCFGCGKHGHVKRDCYFIRRRGKPSPRM